MFYQKLEQKNSYICIKSEYKMIQHRRIQIETN